MNNDIKVIGLYNDDGHLKPEILEQLKAGELCGDALIEALDHIANCEKCASIYADSFSENELLIPPSGLEEEVSSKLSIKSSEKNDFIPYVIKVVIAASIAIMITLSSSYQPNLYMDDTVKNVQQSSHTLVSQINQKVLNLTAQIKIGGFSNDKTKK